jgi:drug/metabolite transporter (DMT)-like permease
MSSILFGLASALSWGAGDFAGGLASRRVGPYRAVFLTELLGFSFVLLSLPFANESLPALETILWSTGAGIFSTIGLLTLFQAMQHGRISIAAPISAVLAAVVPVVVGSFLEGLPKASVLYAFGLAFVAVILISNEKVTAENAPISKKLVGFALFSGASFGLYFVMMNRAGQDAIITPMLFGRFAAMLVTGPYLLFKRTPVNIEHSSWLLLFFSALFGIGGNAFYILAGQTGRMDITAVLSSLYPGTTVLLAWLLLKEKLQISQWVGILLALIAIILITIG